MTLLATAARLTGELFRQLADRIDPTQTPAETPPPAVTTDWLAGPTQQLWCEPGKHQWTRASVRGRKPMACPRHQ